MELQRSGLSQKKGGTAVEQGWNDGRIYGGTTATRDKGRDERVIERSEVSCD